MPLNLPSRLPAVEILKSENIFVMDSQQASTQDIRPLRIVILNLMPLKITTETDLIRLLSNTPLQIEVDFLKISGHISKNTPVEHMMTFYKDFSTLRNENYDGMIITGAPVEQMPFEEVDYWKEVSEIFDWARTHVIFVGRLKQDCTIFMVFLNIRCRKKCSGFSNIKCMIIKIRYSEDSMMNFMCLIAGIRRCVSPI